MMNNSDMPAKLQHPPYFDVTNTGDWTCFIVQEPVSASLSDSEPRNSKPIMDEGKYEGSKDEEKMPRSNQTLVPPATPEGRNTSSIDYEDTPMQEYSSSHGPANDRSHLERRGAIDDTSLSFIKHSLSSSNLLNPKPKRVRLTTIDKKREQEKATNKTCG